LPGTVTLFARRASGHDLHGGGSGHQDFRQQETAMGKYVLGWLLGVPMVVLVILYLFFH